MNHHVVFTRFNEMNENLMILEEFKDLSFAEFAGTPKFASSLNVVSSFVSWDYSFPKYLEH